MVCLKEEAGISLLRGRKTDNRAEAALVCQVLKCRIVGAVGNVEAPRNVANQLTRNLVFLDTECIFLGFTYAFVIVERLEEVLVPEGGEKLFLKRVALLCIRLGRA